MTGIYHNRRKDCCDNRSAAGLHLHTAWSLRKSYCSSSAPRRLHTLHSEAESRTRFQESYIRPVPEAIYKMPALSQKYFDFSHKLSSFSVCCSVCFQLNDIKQERQHARLPYYYSFFCWKQQLLLFTCPQCQM